MCEGGNQEVALMPGRRSKESLQSTPRAEFAPKVGSNVGRGRRAKFRTGNFHMGEPLEVFSGDEPVTTYAEGRTIPDLSIAHQALIVTSTLREHLPLPLRDDPQGRTETELARLGAGNCLLRMQYDHPEDLLLKSGLLRVASDLSEAVGGGTITEGELSYLLETRLLIPAYRVLRKRLRPKKQPKEAGPFTIGGENIFTFNGSGVLVNFRVAPEIEHFDPSRAALIPDPHPVRSPLRYYQAVGRLIHGREVLNVRSNEYRYSEPLFRFSQVWPLMELRRLVGTACLKVNFLATTPDSFAAHRERFLADFRKQVEALGGRPVFCGYLPCSRLLDDRRTRDAAFLKRRGIQVYLGAGYCSAKHEAAGKPSKRERRERRVPD